MPRYIDVERLNLYDDLFMSEDTINKSGVYVRYRAVENLIKNAPTADVTEVKHGKWVLKNGYITCSECGCEPYVLARRIDFDNLHHYCPDCGAKMNGG